MIKKTPAWALHLILCRLLWCLMRPWHVAEEERSNPRKSWVNHSPSCISIGINTSSIWSSFLCWRLNSSLNAQWQHFLCQIEENICQ